MRVASLGYPRIGRQRELKFALENYFQGQLGIDGLLEVGKTLCLQRWKRQSELGVDAIPIGEFSFFDPMLDMSLALGVVPPRFQGGKSGVELSLSMAMSEDTCEPLFVRSWFNTNYHYLVPEISKKAFIAPDFEKMDLELQWANTVSGGAFHPVLIGPWTFIKQSLVQGMNREDLNAELLSRYVAILSHLKKAGFEYVQIDEPALSQDLVREDLKQIRSFYEKLSASGCRILIATYYGGPEPWLSEVSSLPCHGVHFDLLHWSTTLNWLKTRTFPKSKELSLGVVSGRNVWATPLWDRKEELSSLVEIYGPLKMTLAPSCPLVHLPLDRALEKQWDQEFASWVSFADQRLEELVFLKRALTGDKNVEVLLKQRQSALASRSTSKRVHRPEIKQAVARAEAKASVPTLDKPFLSVKRGDVPLLPLTTIDSFPQSQNVRKARSEWRRGKQTDDQYKKSIVEETEKVIRAQESLGIDVLVSGGLERSDMVEFFAQSMDGVAISSQGWVQSFGARCVKPPLIFGDVKRRAAVSVSWFQLAQSLTDKPLKALLIGPVTFLNRSFVRSDQPRQKTAFQVALALAEEAVDLQEAGAKLVQIDESAFREGLPMMKVYWNQYLRWALDAYLIVRRVFDLRTQVHVYLSHGSLDEIADTLARLQADVLLVSSVSSGTNPLPVLKNSRYRGAVGVGIFDAWRRRLPTVEECYRRLSQAIDTLGVARVWVIPDAGLKTLPPDHAHRALEVLVESTLKVRAEFEGKRAAGQ